MACELGCHTFRLCKFALFDTRLESLVEHGVELRLGSELDLVVGLDVFLNRLATVEVQHRQLSVHNQSTTECDKSMLIRPRWAASLPATISLFELQAKAR